MMEDLKTYFKKFMRKNIKHCFNRKNYGMSIDLSMIWLPI